MSLTSEDATSVRPPQEPAVRPRRSPWKLLAALVVVVVILDAVAFIVLPPFPRGGEPGQTCAYPVCFINGTLEFPPPNVVIDLDPANPMPTGALVITFHPSISSTMLTMWLISGLLLIVGFFLGRRRAALPGRVQNFAEWVVESLANFATSLGGSAARPYIPIFSAFFVYILFMNWSGLIPPIGRIDQLRAPTSDVNITIGLALVSFLIFEFEGFRAHGIRGNLARFFPIYEFRHGVGAGVLAMYVGLVELLLEFVKPITLAMRLFGNIYGGEVALGVLTAIFLTAIPLAMFLLEGMLNLIQALIFAVLTLMFTLIAIEHHDHEEGELAQEGVAAIEGATSPGDPAPYPSPAA
ncbi:MAG: F0F1 ATP synthase subunit A [Candidatus Limnocylindrales bacterium]